MELSEELISKQEKVAIVGLGYVGIQVAVEFATKFKVIAFDINEQKVNNYRKGIDITNEIGDIKKLNNDNLYISSDEGGLKEAKFFIVAVPTPVDEDDIPDLSFVKNASITVGRNLSRGSIVVYESTVYPGVTEEICVPLLEEASGLKCGVDFKIGYSPERVTPGDNTKKLKDVTKIVSGCDDESLNTIAKTYQYVLGKDKVFQADSIKTAEAAKLLENTQRDTMIALMNEVTQIFDKMGIDTNSVIKAASTKWNFSSVWPGIVGGHCISVDPYYLIYKAHQVGINPKLIRTSREVNEDMPIYVAHQTIKALINSGKEVKNSKILIMGFTYKRNVPDTRNTKVLRIMETLEDFGVDVNVIDYLVDKDNVKKNYGVELSYFDEVKDVDAIICAVAHDRYVSLDIKEIKRKFKDETGIFVEIGYNFKSNEMEQNGITYVNI